MYYRLLYLYSIYFMTFGSKELGLNYSFGYKILYKKEKGETERWKIIKKNQKFWIHI